MAILAECPRCHKKQAVKNRLCNGNCGADLVKEKQRQKVRYWVNYRLPNGKQRREAVGYSISEAQAAEGKRKAQKWENPGVLEKVPSERMTFDELTGWYLDLSQIKKLASFDRISGALANFNAVFGKRIISSLKPLDLEEYQEKREEAGRAPATIDMELVITKTMITKAFDNDLVDGRTLKAFRAVKRKLRRGSNARRRTITIQEFCKLVEVAPAHLKAVLTIAYNTGMRTAEILNLRWSYIDREKWVIRLPAEITKEKRSKVIPINHHVKLVLADLPRAIHHDAVIIFRNKPVTTAGGVHNSFSVACLKAGIPHGQKQPNGITFHDIRRTVKTNMLSAGVDKVYRDTILGHSLHGMDIHYMSPSEDDLHHAISKYTAWLDAQLESVDHIVDQVNITF
jgi:integrase